MPCRGQLINRRTTDKNREEILACYTSEGSGERKKYRLGVRSRSGFYSDRIGMGGYSKSRRDEGESGKNIWRRRILTRKGLVQRPWDRGSWRALTSQWRVRVPCFFPLSPAHLLFGFTRRCGKMDIHSTFPGHAGTDKGSLTRG